MSMEEKIVQELIHQKYHLVILDVDGTLVTTKTGETFRKTADDWQWLPGRVEKLQELLKQGVKLAIATNQGGVGYGYLRRKDIIDELYKMVHAVGNTIFVSVCFTHPKAPLEEYRMEDRRRKPGPGMLVEAVEHFDVTYASTLYVGDRYDDMDAAKAAGVDFLSAIQFFGDEIDPTRDYAKEGTVVYPGYVSPYEFQRGEKHF